MQLFRCLVVQQVQEVTGDAVVIRFGIDPHAVAVESVPVQQHGRQTGEETVRDIVLIREIAFRLNVAKKRHAGA